MSNKDKILSEDQQVYGNRWQQDPSGKVHDSTKLSLMDLIRLSEPSKQHTNAVPASTTPIHGTSHFTELLGDLYIQVASIDSAINLVKKSPLVNDRPNSKAEIEKMLKKSAFIKKLIKSIGDDIGNFSVDKPAK